MVKKLLISVIFCSNTLFQYSQKINTIEEITGTPEVMPIKNDLCSFVLDRIVYPYGAINDTIEGIVMIDFHVETDGKTTGHRIIRGVRDDLNDEALRVVRLLNFDEPAYTRGRRVRTTYVLSIRFLLDHDPLHSGYTPKIACLDFLNKERDDSFEIGFAVETFPDFNRKSTKSLAKFIAENVREVNIPEGNSRIVVQILADTLGYIIDHKVIRGVNSELDSEALRVCRLLKFLYPVNQCGKLKNFVYTFVLDFKNIHLKKRKHEKEIRLIGEWVEFKNNQ